MKSTTTKLYLKFWWPVYFFAIAFIAASIVLFLVDFKDSAIGGIACLDMIFFAAFVGLLTHRISLTKDVIAGYVVCKGDRDVEIENALRKIYYEYLTGGKYETEKTNR